MTVHDASLVDLRRTFNNYKTLGDGKKVRFAKRSGEVIDG